MSKTRCVFSLACWLGLVSAWGCQQQPPSPAGMPSGGPVTGTGAGPATAPPVGGAQPAVAGPAAGAPAAGVATPAGQAPSLTGSIKGRPFQPDSIKISHVKDKLKVLFATYRKEETFFPDSAIGVDIPIPGSGWEGATLQLGKVHPGSPMLLLTTPKPGSSFGNKDFVSSSSYSLRLTFDRRQGFQVSGTVELQVTDPPGTSLVGKFLGEFQPSLTEPPTEADRPYVTGVCRLPENERDVTVTAELYGMGPLVDVRKSAALLFEEQKFKGTQWSGKSPHQTSIWFDPEKRIRYKHTSLVPGDYVVVLKLSNVWWAWQKVTVEAGSELQLDLSMEATPAGKLIVNLPEGLPASAMPFDEKLPRVIPVELGFTKPLDSFDFTVTSDYDSVEPVTLPAVKAGKYLVRWRKCEAEVEVKPGEETFVTLMPKP